MAEEYYILRGVVSGSDLARYDGPYTYEQTLPYVSSFIKEQDENIETIKNNTNYKIDPLSFPNDVLIVKMIDSDGDVQYDRKFSSSPLPSNFLGQQIFGMSTISANQTFDDIFVNIVQDLSPPRTSTNFTYDFKFAQNRNARISGSSSGGSY